ncbi:MAG: diguanylate cyclase [Cytophagales bacterium]|nr:diguanylate cyclase [Rhizobacter sp.]
MTFVLLVTLWSVVLTFGVVQERRLLEGAQQQLRLINNAVLQQTRGLLQGIESDLAVIDHWVKTHPQNDPRQDTGLTDLVAHMSQGLDGLVSFGFASDTGLAITTPGAAPWLAGTSAVVWPPRMGDVHVGSPQRQTANQPWQWPISRRLERASGDITGVVAWVDLARLSAVHESLREKPAGAVSIVNSTGVVVVRTPPIEGLVGRNLSKNRPAILPSEGSSRGTFQHDGALTGGQPRLASYERLGRYSVTVLVSQEVDEVMAAFRYRRNVGFVVLALLTLLAFAISVLLARSQRATRRSQAEFTALSAAFPLGLFRTDTRGETTYANDAYFQKTGLPRERMAWGWNEIVEASQRDEVKQAWQHAAASGEPINSLLNIHQPGGKAAVLTVRTAPLHVDGKLVGQVGSLEDITERIQQQKAQRMLTAIFEKSTDVVAQVDPQGRLLYLNPAGRALLAMGPEDSLETLHYDDFMPAHREAQVRDQILPTAIANGIWVGETSVLASGGREITVSEMLIVHRDENQQVETFSVVMRDVTQELRSRMELQRSESILKIVAATLPALVAVIDNLERYLFTNDAYDRWVGLPHDRLLGLTVRDALGAASYNQRRKHIEAALAGQRVMFESELDSTQYFEITYIPFRSADGRVAGFVALSQDITTHKRQQQKLLDASQTDTLTGTLNRAGFDLRIHDALGRARHEQNLLALLCIDLDRFKPVNDEHGHAAGDALLKAAAQRLQQALRPSDVLARLGGDEFAVVLAGVKDEPAARTVARKIVSALAEPFEIEGQVLHIGGSVGLALAPNGQGTVQTLMQRADVALYQAKRAGRGRFEVAEHAL